MKNRTPIPRDERPALPAFTPVPRQCLRHDGWTPERQRAFIEALADTGSVETAARMVNMSTEGAYALRRHPQAAGFAAAWEAALNMGWRRLKDEAFERALNGQLVPVFVGGKLMGYRRKKNDRLLMFILSHYGPDGPAPRAKPLTVNVINATATAVANSSAARGAVEGDPIRAIPAADAPDSLPAPDPRDVVAAFAGVPLDDEAQAQIVTALTANAARQRALPIEDDPAIAFIHVGDAPAGFIGEMDGGTISGETHGHRPDEASWTMLDDEEGLARIDAAVESVQQARARGEFDHCAPVERSPQPPPALAAPGEARADPAPATPDEQRLLAEIDALIEKAKEGAATRRPGAKGRRSDE